MSKTNFLKLCAIILGVGLVTGCTQYNVIIANPAGNKLPSTEIDTHCNITPDMKAIAAPHAPPFDRQVKVTPHPGSDEKVDGCALISFRITPDGTPHDVKLVTEYPPNYGYGSALVQSYQQSTFLPPPEKDALYFIEERMKYNHKINH